MADDALAAGEEKLAGGSVSLMVHISTFLLNFYLYSVSVVHLQKWACHACTFLNPPSLNVCDMCFSRRDEHQTQ